MPGDTDDGAETERTPADAFALFSHDLRVAILDALWAAERHALPYAELKRRVGERDSGKFNYHLSQLVGQFVGKDGDAYELLYPGHRVLDAIHSGVLHQSGDVDPVSLDADCRHCGTALTFTLDEYIGHVGCLACDDTVIAFPFDPGGVSGRTDEAVAVAFDRRTRLFWRFAVAGVCPVCAGVISVGLTTETGPELDSHYATDHPVMLDIDCQQCSFYNYPPAAVVALYHPAVTCWLYDHGVDPRATRAWELDFVVDPARTTVRRRDPWEVAVTVTTASERLRATIDGTLSVTALERLPAETDGYL